MIGPRAVYSGSILVSSLKTGTTMEISFLFSMLFSNERVLATCGQPPQHRLKRTKQRQHPWKEHHIITACDGQPTTSEVSSSFFGTKQDSVIIKGTMLH